MPKNSIRDAVAANVIRLLRQERVHRGLSMTALAERAGLSRSMISLVERDLRNPTLDTLLRIADVFGLELGGILTRATRAARRQKHPSPAGR